MAVETGWMAAAETQTPEATKTLAEREASMDGKAGQATGATQSCTSLVPDRHQYI